MTLKKVSFVSFSVDAASNSFSSGEEGSEVRSIFFFAVTLLPLSPSSFNMFIKLRQEVFTLLERDHPLLVLQFT